MITHETTDDQQRVRRHSPTPLKAEKRGVNKFVLGVAVGVTALGGADKVYQMYEHSAEVVSNYEKAHKTITYNSPDNPNDAPDTKYGQQISGQTNPTDIAPSVGATSIPVQPHK